MTRTQKNFEWMTNIIKDVENSKGGDLVTTHIYITQFFNKFDLRTSMLVSLHENFVMLYLLYFKVIGETKW